MIVAPRKFDVLKTNIYLRSEASRSNMFALSSGKMTDPGNEVDMLVLRTSNFQGATITPIIV